MAKSAQKQRRREQRLQEQAALAQREWNSRVMDAARASIPDQSGRAKLLLALFLLGFAAVVVTGLFFAPSNLATGGNASLWLVLLTGLTAGGLSCLAVQGGLLATVIAQREDQDEAEQHDIAEELLPQAPMGDGAAQDDFALAVARQRAVLLAESSVRHGAAPVMYFMLAKLVAYTIMGFGLGWLGSQLKLTPGAQGFVQIAAALFMVATAMHLLKVHPIFRYVILQPPRFITRRIRARSRSKDIFAPAVLGAMTVFMPCAVTQAMQLAAISSGSPIRGAAIMFAFVLGTTPLFFGLGVMATKLGDALHQRFLRVAAIAVLAMGLLTLDTGLRLSGSPVSFSGTAAALIAKTKPVPATVAADGVQEARINVEARGYKPGKVAIKAGKPARIVFVNAGSTGCTSTLAWGGQTYPLPTNGEKAFDLPALKKGEDFGYTCAMGMYGGTIEVV